MKEIKFRAWNGKKMIDEDHFFVRHGSVFLFQVFDDPIRVDFSLMQFTGLTDINGVDIYEGDIVEDEDHYYSVISWDNNDSMYIASDVGGVADLNFPVKIIGNIHQNPELLKP